MIRTKGIILTKAIEVNAIRSCVAENAIKNHSNALLTRGINEMTELFISAEDWINFMIISGVVMMIALRLEDGVKIYDGYS